MRTRHALAALAVALLAFAPACNDARSSKDPSPALASAGTSPDARPAKRTVPEDASVDDGLLALARSARDAAKVLAVECYWRDYGPEIYDDCSWKKAPLAAWEEASTALRSRASLDSGTLPGDLVSFVEQIRLFAEWVDLVHDLSKRGTLSHYQDLAAAWNTWRPGEQIAIDAIPPSPVQGDAGPDAAPMRWEHGGDGPFVRRKVEYKIHRDLY